MKKVKKEKYWRISFKYFIVLFMFALILVPASKANAATINPLENMNKKSVVVFDGIPMGQGCDYFTPEYKESIKLSVSSSNKKVATIKAYSFKTRDNKNFCGYETTFKGYGTTVLTVKAKVGSKIYTKKQTLTYKKYVNPFSGLKIGNINYTQKFNKQKSVAWTKSPSGKLIYKLKKGYKIKSITVSDGIKSKTIKNGNKLPNKTSYIWITVVDPSGVQFNMTLYKSLQ